MIVHLLPQRVLVVSGFIVLLPACSFSTPSINEMASWQRRSVSVSLQLFSWKMCSYAKNVLMFCNFPY